MNAPARMMVRVAVGIVTLTIAVGILGSMAPSAKPVIHASLTRPYSSIDEMMADSTAVVLAVPISSRKSTLNTVPITLATVRVTELLAGQLSEKSIEIQQFGSADADSVDSSPLLVSPNVYLLFVRPFDLGDGPVPGIYVLTGDQGAYQFGGTKFRYAGSPLAESEGLPRSLGQSQLESIAGDAR